MKALAVEPLFVLAWFAFEPFRELLKVIDELSAAVLNALLDLALVLRARRKRKMSIDAGLTEPFLPLLP
jgi:hypothetical protein